MKKFTLNREDYLWTGSGWLNSNYVKPSRQVIEELNRRFGHMVAAEKSTPLPKLTTITRQSMTIQTTIAPLIAEIIYERFAIVHDYVTRAEIVEHLIARPEIRVFLQEAHQNTSGELTFEEYVGNQVDFFSKGITQGYSAYVDQFDQKKIEDKWAYQPLK